MAKTEFFAKSKEGFLKKLFGAAIISLGLFAFAGTKAMAATETEDNGGIATANEISVNEKVTGNISTRYDEDWYTFTLNEPGTISLTFSHEGCDDLEYEDWYTMLKGKDELFNYSWNGGGESEKATDNYMVTGGTYYLRVDCKHYVTGISHNSAEYGVKINFTPAGSKTMLRLYNPNSGEHFYTASEREKNALVAQGWSFEGKAWEAPEFSNTPVYRLYNKNSGDHHYTPSEKERDNLIKQGWKDEGIGWYSDDNKRVPLYRLYNPNAVTGQHHYTTSARERDNLVKQGWKDENIGWYGL